MISESAYSIGLKEHMMKYQVSLGTSIEYPLASGTFVKFNAPIGGVTTKVYGIFTAKHALDNDDPNLQALCKSIIVEKETGRQLIILSKLINNIPIGCYTSFIFFEGVGLKKGVRSTGRFDRDIGFICLGFEGYMATHELLQHSDFYDLDHNQENDLAACTQSSVLSGFYRGACNTDESIKQTITIGPYIGGGETIAYNQKSKVPFWKIPNPKKILVHGASGAAFWRLHLQNNIPCLSLAGTVVCLSDNHERIHATAAQYLYEYYLPELKKTCAKELTKFKKQ